MKTIYAQIGHFKYHELMILTIYIVGRTQTLRNLSLIVGHAVKMEVHLFQSMQMKMQL